MWLVKTDIDQLLESTYELASEVPSIKIISIEIDLLLESTKDW